MIELNPRSAPNCEKDNVLCISLPEDVGNLKRVFIICEFKSGVVATKEFNILPKEDPMDPKIKKIQKKTKRLTKDEASLFLTDKKQDKIVAKAKKVVKKKK